MNQAGSARLTSEVYDVQTSVLLQDRLLAQWPDYGPAQFAFVIMKQIILYYLFLHHRTDIEGLDAFIIALSDITAVQDNFRLAI